MSSASRDILIACSLAVLAAIAAECSHDSLRKIEIGQTRDKVIAAVGDPDSITEFTIPDVPFFGPQEGLANLLKAGTLVEEWHYTSAQEVTYVWFAAKSSEPREQWTVVDTATFPADAVY